MILASQLFKAGMLEGRAMRTRYLRRSAPPSNTPSFSFALQYPSTAPLKHVQFALKRPILRPFDETMPTRIGLHILPFLIISFPCPNLSIPEIPLPYGLVFFYWPIPSHSGFPEMNPMR